jgi:cytochrome c-type biogenesis protein CcmH/NrfF
MKKEIAERLDRGEGRETILAAFRTRYGEKVLSAPTFHGFNWFAWVTPFAAVLIGAFAVTIVIRRWTRQTPVVTAPPPRGGPGDAALRERLARELAELDREP